MNIFLVEQSSAKADSLQSMLSDGLLPEQQGTSSERTPKVLAKKSGGGEDEWAEF